MVVLVVLAGFVFRRAGQSGMAGVLWVCGTGHRRRDARLYAARPFRGSRPGRRTPRDRGEGGRIDGALAGAGLARSACLDAVASVVVENACEKPLFAKPEAVAAAVAYVDARFSLLAPSVAIAERDPSYRPVVERLRRALEADRFGLVAHVLTTRGCNGADCAELRLLHDPARVVANMKAHAFEAASRRAYAGVATEWNGRGRRGIGAAGVATAPPLTTTGTGGPFRRELRERRIAQFDFPSANSIPAGQHHERGARSAAGVRTAPHGATAEASVRDNRAGKREAAPPSREVAPPPPQRTPQPAPPPPAQPAQIRRNLRRPNRLARWAGSSGS